MNRDNRIYIRVSEKELEGIEKRAESYGMDKSSFIRMMVLQGELKIPSASQNTKEEKPMTTEERELWKRFQIAGILSSTSSIMSGRKHMAKEEREACEKTDPPFFRQVVGSLREMGITKNEVMETINRMEKERVDLVVPESEKRLVERILDQCGLEEKQ